MVARRPRGNSGKGVRNATRVSPSGRFRVDRKGAGSGSVLTMFSAFERATAQGRFSRGMIAMNVDSHFS